MAPVVFSALRVSTVLAGIVLGISLLLVGLVKAAETESGCLVAPREGTPCLSRSQTFPDSGRGRLTLIDVARLELQDSCITAAARRQSSATIPNCLLPHM
jgi:hypothetical protein